MTTTEQPLVSVLMTAYNRERYIADAMQSVLSSTYKNLELLIVDDGSRDQTINIAREFEKRDSRVKVFQNAVNLGDYPNRNQAAAYASGKYLKYIDSDDYIYPWALEILVSSMEQFPEAGWGLCSMKPVSDKPFPFMLTPREAYEYHYLGPGLFKRAPLSSIIRKDVFEQVGGFRPIRMAGDYDMWNRLGQKFPVVLMPEGMVWYRIHAAQEMNDYIQFINKYEELKVGYLRSPECPLDKETVLQLLRKERKTIRQYMVKNLLKGDWQMLRINWRNAGYYRNL